MDKLLSGTKPRGKPYHHGNLRSVLLQCAVRHLKESGVERLSLRALAREIGVSQAAPYRHFKDKNSLLVALATDGFEKLKAEIEDAVKRSKDDPETAFIETGMAYVRFAMRSPEQYKLMFGTGIKNREDYKELCEAGDSAYGVLVALIETGLAKGRFGKAPVGSLAMTAWAMSHGLATLFIDRIGEQHMEEQITAQTRMSSELLLRGFSC